MSRFTVLFHVTEYRDHDRSVIAGVSFGTTMICYIIRRLHTLDTTKMLPEYKLSTTLEGHSQDVSISASTIHLCP